MLDGELGYPLSTGCIHSIAKGGGIVNKGEWRTHPTSRDGLGRGLGWQAARSQARGRIIIDKDQYIVYSMRHR